MPAPDASFDLELKQAQQRWDAQFRRDYVRELPFALLAVAIAQSGLVLAFVYVFRSFEFSTQTVALIVAWLVAGLLISPLGLVFARMPPRPTAKQLRKERELMALYRALQEKASSQGGPLQD